MDDGGKSEGRPENNGSVAGRLPAGRDGWKADGQSRDVPEGSGKPCRHLCAPFLPGFWLGGRFFRRIRAGSACTRCRALRQMARCASDLQPADAVPVCQGRVPDQVRVRTVLRMTCMCKKITQTGRRFRHACHTERRRSDDAAGGRPGMREAPRDRAVPGRCRRVTAGQAGAACRHRGRHPGSEVAVEEGGELALGDGAHLGAHQRAVLEQHQRGNTTDAVLGGRTTART